MILKKLSPALGTALTACVLLGTTATAQAQTTTTERTKGVATVSTSELKGEVVQVEGNDLLVKLSTGDLKTFRVPESRRFVIDGNEVSVHELQPGTTLTATVKTTTTPVTVRTKSVLSGKVWYVAPPRVILTLPTGENKMYVVKDDVKFTVNDQPATVFDLRKGMTVAAVKIVEEPDVEIAEDTKVVGQAPVAATARAAAPTTEPAQPSSPAPAAESAQVQPSAAAAAETQPATEPGTPPAAPQAEGGSRTLLWAGLILAVIIVALIAFRRSRARP